MTVAASARSRQDDGLLGPDSVSWEVMSHPSGLVGGLLALMLQALHPHAMAGVAQHSNYSSRPLDRLQRTSMYVIATVYGDTPTAHAAAARVRAIHKRVRGIDPVTGQAYSAEDPDTQLWIHSTVWHSILVAYRVYHGRLTPAEEDRYFAESARIAELVGVPAERVPASVAEMRDYYAAMEPHLCVSADARAAIDFVVNTPASREMIALLPGIRLFGRGAVALMPHHLRPLAGVSQSRVIDAAVTAALRPVFATLGIPQVERLLMGPTVGAETVRIKQHALERRKAVLAGVN